LLVKKRRKHWFQIKLVSNWVNMCRYVEAWTCDPGTGRWSAQSMSFGDFGVDNVLACEFLKPSAPPGGEVPPGAVVTGMPDGTLLVWRNGKAVRRVRAHGGAVRVVST
jgi:hypothetical protein